MTKITHHHVTRFSLILAACLLLLGLILPGTPSSGSTSNKTATPNASLHALPRYDHIVVVIDENHGYGDILGNPDAPYINHLAHIGANFTNSHAIEHPSQPNYLCLFSGSNQNVHDDGRPDDLPFTTPNLGAQLLANHLTFIGYCEGLPGAGYNGNRHARYVRKHNPWVNWQATNPNPGRHQLPASANRPLTAWPSDLAKLPAVAFVIPDLAHDMHDGTIRQGDVWLHNHLNAYITWARTHHSLFILTFDEDDFTRVNHIPTLFVGAHIKPGDYADRIDHFDVLRTIEDLEHLPPIGKAAGAKTITACFIQK